jgi:hypothetical protein
MMMVMYNEGNAYLAVSEILHTMGLKDLYTNVSGGFGPYGGMATFYGDTNILGFEKYSLGWMAGKDVICLDAKSKKVKLSSLDSKGVKLILIPINGQEMLGIEYKKSRNEINI